jgi:hypothetical protein
VRPADLAERVETEADAASEVRGEMAALRMEPGRWLQVAAEVVAATAGLAVRALEEPAALRDRSAMAG